MASIFDNNETGTICYGGGTLPEDLYEEIPAPEAREEGRKDDTGKLPFHLYPPEALEGTLRVLDFGQRKYAPRNWEKGLYYSRVFGSLMRHMWAWWGGQDIDEDSGESHLHCAGCCIAFLQTYHERGMVELDDRPTKRH